MGLLHEYVSLKKESDSLFEEWQKSCDGIGAIETKILAEFGLPNTFDYKRYLIGLEGGTESEKEFDSVLVRLHQLGVEYSRSSPQSDLEILQNARINGLEADQVFPLIGVFNSIYTEFIYNQVFMPGRENEENTLKLLRTELSSESLTNLHFFIQEILKLKLGLNPEAIPYFKEFLTYDSMPDIIFDPRKLLIRWDQISPSNYKTDLNEVISMLQKCGEQLFNKLIQLARNGEFLELEDELTDALQENDLRYMDDGNAKIIVKLLDAIAIAQHQLIGNNSLDLDSIGKKEFDY